MWVHTANILKNGMYMWSRALGGAAVDLAYFDQASGNYYVAGTSSSGCRWWVWYLVPARTSKRDVELVKIWRGTDWDFINAGKSNAWSIDLSAGEAYTFSTDSDAWNFAFDCLADTLLKHFGSDPNYSKGHQCKFGLLYLLGHARQYRCKWEKWLRSCKI